VEQVADPAQFRIVAQSRQTLTVSSPPDSHGDLRVFSLTGQLRKSTGATSSFTTIDISDLAPGAYLLAVQSGRTLATKSFLVY
jgi:hypothetical protein